MRSLNIINKHFENNFWLYIISIFCMFLGIVLGIYTVKYMGPVEKEQLTLYLSKFTNSITQKNINYKDIFFQSIRNNLPIIIGIWFLGLTMIGTPLILIIDIIKGYTLGFTISFIIKGVGVKGIWITLLGILPQNIIYLPCMMFASVSAMEFSLAFFKNNMYKHWATSIFARIATYSLIFVGIFICMCLGFVLEAYITPYLIKMLIH
ncbi:MAG: stage II sporulation protein M [Clostridiaceae bacterium]|nr:stage II sporulation protein M [Clostridiaceae bacterium]